MRTLTLSLVAAIGLTTTANTYADKNEIKRLAETNITLQQAIENALAHQDGQAYEAELEDDSFAVEYEVKIFSDDKRYKITVDGQTGEIKRVREKK